jgi:DNA-binding MarR family transcriptional regulator
VQPLTADEAELWRAWEAANATLSQVSAEVAAETGLSEPDLAVLTRLHDADGGRLRQSELGAVTGWHRSRLSHHLRRMTDRGLVAREEVPGGVEVRLTTMGRAATVRARPVHAAAVRRHLVQVLPARDRQRLLALLSRLAVSRPPGS